MTIGFSHEENMSSQKETNTQEFFSILQNSAVLTDKQIDRLMHLIHDGINVNAQVETSHSPLHACIKLNNLKLVEKLIQFGANVNLENNFTDDTVLHAAVMKGNEEMVLLLIHAGANINAIGILGRTPLHRAFSFGAKSIAKLLLHFGAKSDIKAHDGITALHLAALTPQSEIMKAMLENKVEVDVNVKDNLGNTPLHMAIMHFPDTVQLLLNAGADLSATNNDGRSPLQKRFGCPLPSLIEKSVIFIINKFFEAAGGWRFDHLCKELGGDFISVETADEMAAKIIMQEPLQYVTSIRIIEELYHNAAKMTPRPLLTRLFEALKNSPAETSTASSSSLVCTDDGRRQRRLVCH